MEAVNLAITTNDSTRLALLDEDGRQANIGLTADMGPMILTGSDWEPIMEG